jgi:benzoyl-CoA reductase subunit C
MEAPLTAASADAQRTAILERADALYRDTSFSSVLAWKKAHPGRRAIGFLPVYAPREVIHAAGMLPVGVLGGGDMEIVKGDASFQSYICHLPRSTVELGCNGSLDGLDGMIFPSTCDVIRNLSGMWQIMFPDKYVYYFDMPQNFSEEVGGRFYEHGLRTLIADLERLGGRKVTDELLRAAISEFNENRRLLAEIEAMRVAEPWQVPASELFLLLRAGCVLPVEEHSAMLRAYMAAARAGGRRPMDMARVAIRGCFCEQPPLDLIRTLERSGCFIVDDDCVLGLRWMRSDVAVAGDPVRNLVRAFLDVKVRSACPSVYQDEGGNGAALVASVRRSKAEGVIFAAASFCDPALLDQPMTMAAVKAAGIPCTSFLYSENTGQFQVIREQAGTFADSIRLA